jgi:hypothetical protein
MRSVLWLYKGAGLSFYKIVYFPSNFAKGQAPFFILCGVFLLHVFIEVDDGYKKPKLGTSTIFK